MKLKRRNGFALIYTVLIGALVFVGIVGLTMRIVPENAITSARTHSQRALSTAEAGASQVLFDLRSFSDNDFIENSGEHYLTEQNIKTLIDGENLNNLAEKAYTTSDSFKTAYQAKIKVTPNNDEVTNNNITTGSLNVDLYILGTVSDKANNNVLARKAVKTSFTVEYNKRDTSSSSTVRKWHAGVNSSVVDYALFSGTNISFNGAAQTADGDIHACGSIYLGSKGHIRVLNGDAEAEGGIFGNKSQVTGNWIEGSAAPEVAFPIIDIDNYRDLADAFRSGTAPYDGEPVYDKNGNLVNYADTSNPIVLSVVQSYLGAPGTSSSLSGIDAFYHDLMNGTGGFVVLNPAQINDLRTYAKSIVYYVEGPVHINGQFECIGTLVVDGDPNQENLIINGNSQVGDPNDPGAAAILVQGSIKMANGTADLYGLFYSTGSIRGTGTFNCDGSIITQESIDLNGTFDVHYVPITWNPNLGISDGYWEEIITVEPGETIYSVDSAASLGSSYTWKEISYDEFDAQ